MGRVLVIDDDVAVLDFFFTYLTQQSQDVRIAESGTQGIKLAREFKPQIIFLDIVMPGLGGIDTLKRLREQMPQTDVIMISGNADHPTALKALEMGAVDFIEKPFDLEYLSRLLLTRLALAPPP